MSLSWQSFIAALTTLVSFQTGMTSHAYWGSCFDNANMAPHSDRFSSFDDAAVVPASPATTTSCGLEGGPSSSIDPAVLSAPLHLLGGEGPVKAEAGQMPLMEPFTKTEEPATHPRVPTSIKPRRRETPA